MVQTIRAENISLYDLITRFGLQRTDDAQFFREWQDDLPQLTDLEKQALDEVKGEYLYLSERSLVEEIVKLVVLSPLLKLAGFYRPPFYLTAEKEVRIVSEDEQTQITGRIDVLVFHPEFWVTVIEAKRAAYSLEAAIPQALAYMLGNPHQEKPAFGFVTNGSEFRFLKLVKQERPKYAQSHLFSLDRGDDLYSVVSILKQISQLLRQ